MKPRLRGKVHAWAILPMLVAAGFLIAFAPTPTARTSLLVYSVAIVGMLAASATYHRAPVSERARVWLRRLDHSMIGVAVAGTYTPVIVLLLDGALRATLLSILWIGALGSLILSFAWPHAPRLLRASVYLGLGWAGVIVMPWLWTNGGVAAFAFVVAGAIFYTAGAVVYALKRPDPWPYTFGFHEVFHTLVVLAAVSHFAAVTLVVARTA
jgi:hemolysin III